MIKLCGYCNGKGIRTQGRTHDAGGRKLYGPSRRKCNHCDGTGKQIGLTIKEIGELMNKSVDNINELDLMARCLICRSEFTREQIKGFNVCPNCGTDSLPCNPHDDIAITINPRELATLTMWAMHYANSIKETSPDSPKVIKALCNHLRKQIPDCPALTLDEEIDGLKKEFGVVETDIPKDPTNMPKIEES